MNLSAFLKAAKALGYTKHQAVVIGNQAGTYPANLAVATATSQFAPYVTVLFGGVEVNEPGATVTGVDGARSGIVIPDGFSAVRFSSLVACGDSVNNSAGNGWYASRIYSNGPNGLQNLGNERMKALAADAFSTPSINIPTYTPWLEIGVTLGMVTGMPLVSVGDVIDVRVWQNSGVALSMPFDTPSTWLMAEFK